MLIDDPRVERLMLLIMQIVYKYIYRFNECKLWHLRDQKPGRKFHNHWSFL